VSCIKKNLLSFIIIAILGFGFIISFVFLRVDIVKGRQIETQIRKKVTLVEKYNDKKRLPPSREAINYLLKKKKELLENYEELTRLMDACPVEAQDSFPLPLEFKGVLFNTQERIRKTSPLRGLTVVGSLGFDEYEKTIPTKDEIPVLTVRLNTLEELVKLMTLSKISVLKEVEFFPLRTEELFVRGKKVPFYKGFPVRVSLVSSTPALCGFLYSLNVSDTYFFVVRSLQVKEAESAKDKTGDVSYSTLDISVVQFLEAAEETGQKAHRHKGTEENKKEIKTLISTPELRPE